MLAKTSLFFKEIGHVIPLGGPNYRQSYEEDTFSLYFVDAPSP